MNTLHDFDRGACRYGLDATVRDLISRNPAEVDAYLRTKHEATKRAERAGRDYAAWVQVPRGCDTLIYSDGRTVRA